MTKKNVDKTPIPLNDKKKRWQKIKLSVSHLHHLGLCLLILAQQLQYILKNYLTACSIYL